MSDKMCPVCDQPFLQGEPKSQIDGYTVHKYCDFTPGSLCDTEDCQWRWCAHSGECQ